MTIAWDELERAAREARERAYAPYSSYLVGAAVLTTTGRTFAGCNVENASYGLCLCAERGAIAQMIAAGERAIEAVVVVTAGEILGTPCGMCRQTIAEFARPSVVVRMASADGTVPARSRTIGELLPEAFDAGALASQRNPTP